MNPFDDLNANFDQSRLDAYMQARQPQGGMQGGFGLGPQNAMAATAPQPQKKKKNFLVDNISTVGGMLGGAAGGIAGAVGGLGVGAVPGMAVGGAAGSALGETLENWLTGDNLTDNVAKEAALGGIFSAGPIRAAKTALGARAALGAAKSEGAELGLREAVKQGSDEAMKFTLRGTAGKALTDKSKEFATKQFGLTDNFIAKYASRHKEDPGKTITRLGIGTLDDFDSLITKNQQAFDDLVRNANPVDKNTLRMKFARIVDEFVNKAPTDQKNLARQIQDEVDQMVDALPDKIPATTVNQIRKQYDDLVNYAMKNPASTVPYKTNVNSELAGGLREALQEASGSDQLKKTGAELSKLYSLRNEALARAPQVASRGSSPLGFRNLLGAAAGGGVGFAGGGPIGGLVGMGAVAAANSPTARRAYTSGAIKAGGALMDMGVGAGAAKATGAGIARDQGIRGAVRAGLGTDMGDPAEPAGATTLEDLLAQSQSDGSMSQLMNPMTTASAANPMSVNNDMMGAYQEPPQSANPYSRDALLYDINRDPANAAKYIAYYQQLDEIFGNQAVDPMGDLSQSSRNALASSDNAINTVTQLEDMFTQAGGASGRLGGRLKGVAGAAGLDEGAKVYNDLANASVTQIAKALAGSGAGTVSDMDAKVIINALPRFDDTPQEAQAKFNALKQRLMTARENTLLYGGGAEQPLQQTGGLY